MYPFNWGKIITQNKVKILVYMLVGKYNKKGWVYTVL